MSEFLVVGEALVDIVEHSTGTRAVHPGGSPANVALGLARLGESVDLLTWLSTDPRGRVVADHLAASGVDILPASLGADRTSTALARLDLTGAATYEFDLQWQLPQWVAPQETIVVHTGSIAAVAATEPRDALLRLVRDAGSTATITYDPNLRPSIMGSPDDVRPAVDDLVAAADVVKVSDEDLAWLHPGVEPADVASSWVQDHGCALVVVTRGGRGSLALLADGRRAEVPAHPATVVDTVGAGDAYMSGLLAALHQHDLMGADRRGDLRAIDEPTVTAILAFAARVAAITVGRAGANPPHLKEVAPVG